MIKEDIYRDISSPRWKWSKPRPIFGLFRFLWGTCSDHRCGISVYTAWIVRIRGELCLSLLQNGIGPGQEFGKSEIQDHGDSRLPFCDVDFFFSSNEKGDSEGNDLVPPSDRRLGVGRAEILELWRPTP